MKVIAVILLLCGNAHAHDAPSGWAYDHDCCHDSDCGPAITAIRNLDGSLTVTTKHGTATFPRDFKTIRRSPDGEIHACFTTYRLYCLYLSAGI